MTIDPSDTAYEFSQELDRGGGGYTVYRSVHGHQQHKLALMSYTAAADAAFLKQTLELLEMRHRLRRRQIIAAGGNPSRRAT